MLEIIASLVYTPGSSLEQRPDPPTPDDLSHGQRDFLRLCRELELDVTLVKFMRAYPLFELKISKQSYAELEMGLRGAFLRVDAERLMLQPYIARSDASSRSRSSPIVRKTSCP